MRFLGIPIFIAVIAAVFFFVLSKEPSTSRSQVIDLDTLLETLASSVGNSENLEGFLSESLIPLQKAGVFGADARFHAREDGALLAYIDGNNDGEFSANESEVAVVEVDRLNQRFIATDLRFNLARASKHEVVAGAPGDVVLQELIRRQDKEGIAPSRFNDRDLATDEDLDARLNR